MQPGNGIKTIGWVMLLRLIRLRFPQVKPLSTDELARWLQSGKSLLLLDVRTPEEYQVSHLLNAQLAPAHPEELADIAIHETLIVTYCSVGYRSAKFAQKLQQSGYKQVFNLEGSIFKWVNEGWLVYQNGTSIEQVHPYNQFWKWFLK